MTAPTGNSRYNLSSRQIDLWVDRPVVLPHFVMEVRRCGPSRHADAGNDFALSNLLPNVDVESIQMAVARRQSIDRKSTRLNSSHMSISYAVFCLKKKKKKKLKNKTVKNK